jgi:hypothetical protein
MSPSPASSPTAVLPDELPTAVEPLTESPPLGVSLPDCLADALAALSAWRLALDAETGGIVYNGRDEWMREERWRGLEKENRSVAVHKLSILGFATTSCILVRIIARHWCMITMQTHVYILNGKGDNQHHSHCTGIPL